MPPKRAEIPCANPLFLSWVGEWFEAAKTLNSKGAQTYKKAYESIRSCPISYEHPSDLIRLNGIGPIICKKLEEKLKVYCAAEGLPLPNKPGHTNTEPTDLPGPAQGTKRKTTSTRQYIPKYRSGGWAILRALETFPQNASVTKAEIIRIAHQFCDSSFETPLENKFYTAWNSMKLLLEKGYVYKNGNPPKFCLTDEGLDVAKTLIKASEGMSSESGNITVVPGEPPAPKRTRPMERQTSFVSPDTFDFPRGTPQVYNPPPVSHFSSRAETHVLPAGSYTIQLIMDNREIHSQVDRDRLEREIGEGGIDYTVRALDVGDALWIAKSGTDEYVLDYIVERKRIDDLVSSITDGRFHEQKFRLMKSGMQHIIYLIEDKAGFEVSGFLEAIQTSISSSQTVNQFFVKRSKHIEDTIQYLVRMSKFLIKLHQKRPLTVIPESQIDGRTFYNLKASLAQPNVYHCVRYQDFAAIASKSASLNVGDVFLKMLMSIKGISAEKAIEIQKHFPTMIQLVEALSDVDEAEGRLIVGQRCSKYGRKKIGPALSLKVYEVFRPH